MYLNPEPLKRDIFKWVGNLVQNVAQCAHSANVDFSDRRTCVAIVLCSVFTRLSPYGRRCCPDLFSAPTARTLFYCGQVDSQVF